MSNSKAKFDWDKYPTQGATETETATPSVASNEDFDWDKFPQDSKPARSSKGFAGIGEDIERSVAGFPAALGHLLSSIPGGVSRAGRYATSENPLETLGNIGAGGTESLAALLSSPQLLTRYLTEKFPGLAKRLDETSGGLGGDYKDPTFYETLMKFEKEHGLLPKSEEEGSVRSLGSLLFGGKGLSKIKSAPGRVTAEGS